jgi:hypothetical protein
MSAAKRTMPTTIGHTRRLLLLVDGDDEMSIQAKATPPMGQGNPTMAHALTLRKATRAVTNTGDWSKKLLPLS